MCNNKQPYANYQVTIDGKLKYTGINRVHIPNGTVEQNLLTTQKHKLVLNEANTLYVLDFWNQK